MSRRRNILTLLLLASLVTLLVWGCLPAKTEGKGGNFAFAYDIHDSLAGAGLTTPIAVGARMDIAVITNDTARAAIPVTSATSANNSVLDVIGTNGHIVTVEAKAAGSSEFSVDTASGTDSVDLLAAELGSVTLTLPRVIGAPEATELVFLVGGTSTFAMAMKDASGNKLVGYGLDVVTFNPATSGSIVSSKDVEHVRVRIDAAGEVGLQPTNGQEIVVTGVAPADVTVFAFDDGDGDITNALPGIPLQSNGEVTKKLLFLRAELVDGRRAVGLTGVVTLTSSTPEICDVTLDLGSDFLEQLTDDAFVLEARTAGECQISATLGSINASASLQVTQ